MSSHSVQQQGIISWLDCDVQQKQSFIQQLTTACQWLELEEAPKHFPKPNLHEIKGPGQYLVVCCQSDPLQLSELQKNH